MKLRDAALFMRIVGSPRRDVLFGWFSLLLERAQLALVVRVTPEMLSCVKVSLSMATETKVETTNVRYSARTHG